MQGPTIVEGKQLARIGDEVLCSCPGGPHKIITGAQTAFLYGIQIALVGDKSSCGATIVNGTSFFSVHGANAAFDGSQTSCGGIVKTPQHHYASETPASNPAAADNLSARSSTTTQSQPPSPQFANARADTSQDEAPCNHPDQALDLAAYIVDEIQKNTVSEPGQLMRKLNAGIPIDREEELSIRSFFERRGKKAINLTYQGAAIGIWAYMVRQGGEWDHKNKIAKEKDKNENLKFSTLGKSSYRWHHKYKEYEYYYDIWSNIHYAYLGVFCGFSKDLLMDGAGLEQVGTDIFDFDKEVTDRSDINGSGLRRFDDSTDNLSIRIGFDLFENHPDRSALTAEIVMQKVATTPFPIRIYSKILHNCELVKSRVI